MKALLQRVTESSVTVDGKVVGKIGKGLCVLLGIHRDDEPQDSEYIISRILKVKLWPDEATGAPWKKSVEDIQGEIMVVSQFTLNAICGKKGRAPDFHLAMKPECSRPMFDQFVLDLKKAYREDAVQTGCFQAYMSVHILNDGPVTVEFISPHHAKKKHAVEEPKAKDT